MVKKLLIGDDDVDIVEMLDFVLENIWIEIIMETDSRNLLKLITDVRPNLVLMDLRMPFLTRPQILENMRQDSYLSLIPVLIMSAVPNGREIAMAAGANGYIAKPFDIEHLLGRVKELILNI